MWLAVESNEEGKTEEFKGIPVGTRSPNVGKFSFSKILKRRSKSINEVQLTIEMEEKLEMTHSEIAHWIDTKARWMFPLFFGAFVIFYFVTIKYEVMDNILFYV